MSQSRLQGPRRKTREPITLASKPDAKAEVHRFVGISLSGGKADKACVATIEFYPGHEKVFLVRLIERIKNEAPVVSADYKLYEILSEYQDRAEILAFDVPLQLPKCLRCDLPCPGYEKCSLPEISWLRNVYEKFNKNKKPKRIFTPYTQRCAETYISLELEEKIELQHTLGSNIAPLTARALFIARRLPNMRKIEVLPRLSIWRIGQELKVSKTHLRLYKHSVTGDESRRIFLQSLSEKTGMFIYQQDFRHMVENSHAFEAFICAYTAYLSFTSRTEKPPLDFPIGETWIEFPRQS